MSDQPKKIVEKREFKSSAFDDMLKRMSGSAAEGTQPKSFRYREMVLTIPLEGLRPETYDAPIELTLRELSSEGEMRAYRATGAKSENAGSGTINQPETDQPDVAGAGLMVAAAMAREAIHAVNGRVMQDSYEKAVAWNSLTAQARTTIANMFFSWNTDEDIAKKIEDSLAVR